MNLRRCSFRIIRVAQPQGTHAPAHSTAINITILFNGFCNTVMSNEDRKLTGILSCILLYFQIENISKSATVRHEER
jgi:hypothetical protein